MRIIGWNSNYNNRRRSFEADLAFLDSENADLLSETARPVAEAEGYVAWVGTEAPGLGVIARNGYTVSAHDNNSIAPTLFGAFHVRGPSSLNLLAAWPVQRAPGPSYSQLLRASLDVFSEFLAAKRVVIMGDLNTTSRVKSQAQTHPEFVAKAAALGLTSIYHHQTGESHGQETLATYRYGGSAKSTFHIDYCFLSLALLGSASIRVLNGAEWEARSDHFPIVVDLRNAETSAADAP